MNLPAPDRPPQIDPEGAEQTPPVLDHLLRIVTHAHAQVEGVERRHADAARPRRHKRVNPLRKGGEPVDPDPLTFLTEHRRDSTRPPSRPRTGFVASRLQWSRPQV